MPTIKRFTGINNKSDPRDARDGDLQTATNVVIMDGGSIKRRSGKTELGATSTHSLYSIGSVLYYVQAGKLIKLDGTPSDLVDPLSDGSTAMSYLTLNDKVYYSNGTDKGYIKSGAVYKWGVTAPTQPTCADAVGTGDPGSYLVSITYLLSDGQESAASQTVAVDVVSGGIALTNIPVSADARVTHKWIYVSSPNGEAGETGSGLFRAVKITNATTSVTIRDLPASGDKCMTLNAYPMPAGKYMTFYRGRVYTASGQWLFYSLPWNYELMHLQYAGLYFESNITSLIALENGIWVGTETESVFLAGNDPMEAPGFQIRNRIPGRCLTGSVTVERNKISSKTLNQGMIGLFVTKNGIYAGDGTGYAENLTGEYWIPPANATQPTGIIDSTESNGWRYIFCDGTDNYAMNLKTASVTKMMTGCNSFTVSNGTLYAAGTAGLWSIDGSDDNGTAIAASFSKSGLDFKTNKIKFMPSIVYHMSCDGSIVTTISNGITTATIGHADNTSSMHGSKTKLPRGIRGRNLSLVVANYLGSFFEIAEMDMEVEVAQYRRENRAS